LVFQPGETNKTIQIVVNGSAVAGNDKTLAMEFSNPLGANLSSSFVLGTILDANAKVSISDAAAMEPTGAQPGFMLFSLTVSPPRNAPLSVTVNSVDDTAHASLDFVAVSNETVTFAAGQTNKQLLVLINRQPSTTSLKRFYLDLSNPQGAGINKGRATGTIVYSLSTETNPPPATTNNPVVVHDFNQDGVPDLLFEDDAGNLAVWFMSGDDLISAAPLTPGGTGDGQWRLVSTADFNQDGKTDLLFQYPNGNLAVWLMDGTQQALAGPLAPFGTGDTNWQAVAAADFNDDGKPDVLFQHTDGRLTVWCLNGTVLSSLLVPDPVRPADPKWRVAGTGDFDGDGHTDILFQHADGTLAVWYMKNGKLLRAAFLNPASAGDPDWRVVGTTDQNGDGKPDLLWQHRGDGTLALWYMNGTNLILGKILTPAKPGGTWRLVGQ
jgi:hypothetical protein